MDQLCESEEKHMSDLTFQTSPDEYKHWKFRVDGAIAHLNMDVEQEDGEDDAEYQRKLNSYDIHVDIELADAVERLRFEYPNVKVVVVGSEKERIFCAGANIFMLAGSGHPFKVNFCKFTNETRLGIEDASENTGIKFIAAVKGTASGGGYELALACDEILLIDDRSSAVSFPEVPLLGVLPGTGGLTRVVDKRKVRRDLADVFSTTAEGVRGKRAVQWGLVDAIFPKSKFDEEVAKRADALVETGAERPGAGVELTPIVPAEDDGTFTYEYVTLKVDSDARTATIEMRGPEVESVTDVAKIREQGAAWWPLQAFRELDDALLRLRFNHLEAGLVLLHTRGDADLIASYDRVLAEKAEDDWFIREARTKMKRVLKRLDLTARTVFALADEESCFAGTFLELALAADRVYMLDSPDDEVFLRVGPLSGGQFPMSNGLSRLETRFLGEPEKVGEILECSDPIDAEEALDLGLVTFAPDDLDWEDEIRLVIEERASYSPDALTGMEASLRFAGPETMETKIFGRLSAWQNWIFQRPNAVGGQGALTLYGRPERAVFDWRRT